MALRSDLHGQELVAVKDGRSAETLRGEAAILADLDHPGVIRFVALTEDERGPRLLTRYAGRETLATWQPQRLEELRRVVEDLAAAVDHLHEQGVVHRSIRPNHVVIDAMRRPLLCGFSSARRIAGPGAAATGRAGVQGCAAGAGSPGEQLADVVAIGETVVATLERLAAHRTRPGRRRDEQRLRERLGGVAQAAAGGRVPTAKALAGQIRALGTEPAGLRPPGGGETSGHPPDEPAAGAPATAGDGSAPGRASAPGDVASVPHGALAGGGTPGVHGAPPGGAGAAGLHGAPPSGAGTAGGENGPHADPPTAGVLQRLREPPARGTQRRRRLTVARPSGPRRHPGRAPRRLPHVRQRPRRATVLAVAAVCGGCVLGTLMVMRLVDADAPAPAAVRQAPVGGPATGAGETPTGIPGQGDASPALDLALRPPGGQAAAAPAPPAAAPGLPAPPDGNPAAGTGPAPASPDPHAAAGGGPAPVPPPGAAGADLAALPPTPAAGDTTLCRPIADGFRDVDGDGCAEEIGLTAGFVWVDGTRYPVGDAGDQVAVGDWDCDGLATVALVQPGGRVYVFDSWPEQSPLVGSLVAELAPPVQLADVPRGACNELLVRYAGGTWFLPVPAPAH